MFLPKHVFAFAAVVLLSTQTNRAQDRGVEVAPQVQIDDFYLIEEITESENIRLDQNVASGVEKSSRGGSLQKTLERKTIVLTPEESPNDSAPLLLLEGIRERVGNRISGSESRHRWEAESLYWWISPESAPDLLVSNPAGTTLSQAGLPSAASTTEFGGESLSDQGSAGMRLGGSYQMRHTIFNRIDWSLIYLPDQHERFQTHSLSGSPILGRPFFNTSTGQIDSQLISYPGLADGSFHASYSQSFVGGSALGSISFGSSESNRLEFVGGYQYFRLRDALLIDEVVEPQASPFFASATRFEEQNEFEASNDYHLFPLGLRYGRDGEQWRLAFNGLVAVGFVQQTAEIYGYTNSYVQQNLTGSYSGGLLALPDLVGRHTRTQFALVPQMNFHLARQLRPSLTLRLSYNLMNFNQAVRVATTLPRNIHPGHLPPVSTTAPPVAFEFDDRSVWVHGLGLGLAYRY